MTTCPHDNTEPVIVASEERPVARVCVSCLERLHAGWGCVDCEWVEQRVLCQVTPLLFLARPCRAHQEAA